MDLHLMFYLSLVRCRRRITPVESSVVNIYRSYVRVGK
jgi:hypothetical protein